MRYLIPLVFVLPLLLGVAGVLFTLNKLEKMEQIRGWKPGETVRKEVIRQKHKDPNDGTCWVAFTDESIHRAGPHRINLQPEAWNRLQVGDPIDIVYLPGNPSPYTRDGIFANDGNFEFDRALLVVEIGMIVLSVVGAIVSIGVLILLCVFQRKENVTTA
jgi:hypothetical protein